MLFGRMISVYSENHMEHFDALCGQMQIFSTLKQVVHTVAVF
jgi:hypothetical protein